MSTIDGKSQIDVMAESAATDRDAAKEFQSRLRKAEARMAVLEGALEAGIAAGQAVVDNWDHGNLADAVCELSNWVIEQRANQALSADGSPADTIYRHRKGGLYRIVARGRLEGDLTPTATRSARPPTNFRSNWSSNTRRGWRRSALPSPASVPRCRSSTSHRRAVIEVNHEH